MINKPLAQKYQRLSRLLPHPTSHPIPSWTGSRLLGVVIIVLFYQKRMLLRFNALDDSPRIGMIASRHAATLLGRLWVVWCCVGAWGVLSWGIGSGVLGWVDPGKGRFVRALGGWPVGAVAVFYKLLPRGWCIISTQWNDWWRYFIHETVYAAHTGWGGLLRRKSHGQNNFVRKWAGNERGEVATVVF